MKKLSEINLNLLNVLDVLLTERNTTSAAKKLHLTQPSISYSLKQLREIFDDDLLAKKNFSSTMYLTPLAKTLIMPVREAVQNIEGIFMLKEFDPATSRRCFKVAATDYAIGSIFPKLMKSIRREAPFVTFHFSGVEYSKITEQIEMDDIDMGIASFNLEFFNKSSIIAEPLTSIQSVCFADKAHPAFQGDSLSLNDYMQYPHIIGRFPKPASIYTVENDVMKDYIDTGNIQNISIHNTTEAVSLIPGSDYIGIACADLVEKYADFYGLTYRKPPFEIHDLTVSLCRHENKNNDKAVLWLISKIKDIIIHK